MNQGDTHFTNTITVTTRFTRMDKILDLYARIPAFDCLKGCTACCGIVPFSKSEWTRVAEPKKGKGIDCPYVQDGRCSIYEDRPFMCRIFGTVESLLCPKGCGPEILLSAGEGRMLTSFYRIEMREEEIKRTPR
jgi:hypothetical protein